MFFKNAAHDVALNSCASSMNDPNFSKSGLHTLLKIFFDDAWNIFGSEGVEIDGIFDRENNRFSKGRFCHFRFRQFQRVALYPFEQQLVFAARSKPLQKSLSRLLR